MLSLGGMPVILPRSPDSVAYGIAPMAGFSVAPPLFWPRPVTPRLFWENSADGPLRQSPVNSPHTNLNASPAAKPAPLAGTLRFFKDTLRIGGLLNEIAQAIKPYFRMLFIPLNVMCTAYMTVTAAINGANTYLTQQNNPKLSRKNLLLLSLREALREGGFQFFVNLFVPPIMIEFVNQVLKVTLDGGYFHPGRLAHAVLKEVFLLNQFEKHYRFLKHLPKHPGIPFKGLYYIHPGVRNRLQKAIGRIHQHKALSRFLNQVKHHALKKDGIRLKHRLAIPLTLSGLTIVKLLPLLDEFFEVKLRQFYEPGLARLFDLLACQKLPPKPR